ncbi:thermonuclease family protein [Thermodesulfobacteriota bacterium]
MRVAIFFLLLFSSILSISLSSEEYNHVKVVYDGDTILLQNGQRVRYLGIDAPEIDHEGRDSDFMAHEAKEFNRRILAGKKVRLVYDEEKTDRYGRSLAYVFIGKDKMVNGILVRRGLANVMTIRPNIKYRNYLLKQQRLAMEGRTGIWRRKLKSHEKVYLGNSNTFRFHRPGCSSAGEISRENRVNFNTVFEAFWEGCSPCNRCSPCRGRDEAGYKVPHPLLGLAFFKKGFLYNSLVVRADYVPSRQDAH